MKSKNRDIIMQAVKRAQYIAQSKSFQIGDIVCHPDEDITCVLLEIHGELALIGFGEIQRVFPLRELFDPNVARNEALKIQENLKGLNRYDNDVET